MKCRLLVRLEASPSAKLPPGTWYEIGHEIDNPQAWRLVQQGVAEPADEECEAKAGLTLEQRILRQQAYQDFHVRVETSGGPDEDTQHYDDSEYL